MSENKNMISDEAVEAAARAMHEAAGWDWNDRAEWQEVSALSEARAALEAAAPHMLAAAWEQGVVVGALRQLEHEQAPQAEQAFTPNPYRSQA